MKSKLPNIPVLKSLSARVGASHYNRVQIALNRLGAPLQLMLPGMRGFQVDIDTDVWVCTDRNLNQLPMLAWTEFSPAARDGIAEPVSCRVLFYHPYANVVARTVMDDIAKILNARLKRAERGRRGQVIPFPLQRRRA